MFYLPWNSEIGNLGRGLSYPHSFQTTTKLPLNLPTTAGKIHIGSKEGLVGKFLVSNIPMGGKTGKQNKKTNSLCCFFLHGCFRFWRFSAAISLGGGEDLTEEKWGFSASPTNQLFHSLAGWHRSDKILCQTIILGPIIEGFQTPPTQDAIVTTIGGSPTKPSPLHLGGSGRSKQIILIQIQSWREL